MIETKNQSSTELLKLFVLKKARIIKEADGGITVTNMDRNGQYPEGCCVIHTTTLPLQILEDWKAASFVTEDMHPDVYGRVIYHFTNWSTPDFESR